jgi:hypothetical protein
MKYVFIFTQQNYNDRITIKTVYNKNYMSIAVSVLTTSRVARKSGGAARQESNPQSATAYSSVR